MIRKSYIASLVTGYAVLRKGADIFPINPDTGVCRNELHTDAVIRKNVGFD